MRTCVLSFLFLLAAFSNAYATPAQIVMIRHAEKPPNEEHNELSAKGWKRAHALVEFFLEREEFLEYGPPVAIYAMGQRRPGSSIRAIQTMMPLAEELGLEIHDEYTREEYEEAAEEILSSRKYDGKLVVICWEHDALRHFAEELGMDDAPKWKGSVYDRAWVLDYEDDELAFFTDLPQDLLPGDDSE